MRIVEASESSVQRAGDVLLGGGLVVIPTDTVYGIAAMASEESAVRRIFEVKGRSLAVPLPVLVASEEEARVLGRFDARAAKAALAWPGGTTLVVPRARSGVDLFLGGDGQGIGLRVPAASFAAQLLKVCSPLAVTSANLAGGPNGVDVTQIASDLGERIDLYVDAGKLGERASTVLSFMGSEEDGEILRP